MTIFKSASVFQAEGVTAMMNSDPMRRNAPSIKGWDEVELIELTPETIGYEEYLADLLAAPVTMHDTETFSPVEKKKSSKQLALYPYLGKIRLYQIYDPEKKRGYVVDFGGRGQEDVSKHHRFIKVLAQMFANPGQTKVFHNLNFDVKMIRAYLGIKVFRGCLCTMLGMKIFLGDHQDKPKDNKKAKAYRPIFPKGYSLKAICNYLGITLDKTMQMSDWGIEELIEEQKRYAMSDVYALAKVFAFEQNLYQDTKHPLYKYNGDLLWQTWQLESDMVGVCAYVEDVGYPVAEERVRKIVEDLLTHRDYLQAIWDENHPRFTWKVSEALEEAVVTYLKTKKRGQNLRRSVVDVFEAGGATAEELKDAIANGTTIELFYRLKMKATGLTEIEPKSAMLLQWVNRQLPRELKVNKMNKAKTAAYGETFSLLELRAEISAVNALLNDVDKLIRSAAFHQNGLGGAVVRARVETLTGTGRTSNSGYFKGSGKSNKATETNLQSISSKVSPWVEALELPNPRWAITPGDDMVFGVLDFAQSHARIAAHLSGCETSIKGLNNEDEDNHSKVAAEIAKIQGDPLTPEFIAYRAKDRKQKDGTFLPADPRCLLLRGVAKATYYALLNAGGAYTIQQQIARDTGVVYELELIELAKKGCQVIYPALLGFPKKNLARLKATQIRLFGQEEPYFVNDLYGAVPARVLHRGSPLRAWNEEDRRFNGAIRRDRENNIIYTPPYSEGLAAIWSRIESIALKRGARDCYGLAMNNPEWGLQLAGLCHDEIDMFCKKEHMKVAFGACEAAIRNNFSAIVTTVNFPFTPAEKLACLKTNSWLDK